MIGNLSKKLYFPQLNLTNKYFLYLRTEAYTTTLYLDLIQLVNGHLSCELENGQLKQNRIPMY